MKILTLFLAINVWSARDMDSVMITARGAQALPQICPIMVVAKVETVEDQKSTNGQPPTVKVKVVDSIWGHLKKNNRFKALWLPIDQVEPFEQEYESWSKTPLKAPNDLAQKEVVLGLFPSEVKGEYEFVIKPLCRYLSTDETMQRLTCLREKKCRDFLPSRLVIR